MGYDAEIQKISAFIFFIKYNILLNYYRVILNLIQNLLMFVISFIFVHFFLFDCDAKRKKRTQRKRKHAILLRPSGVQTEGMFSAIAKAIAESLQPRKLGAVHLKQCSAFAQRERQTK